MDIQDREFPKWNWGAFLFTWIWGIGNSTFIALLMFVPFVNIVMPFVLGFKGYQWAWENGTWTDEEHFLRVQRSWAKWGVIIIGGVLLINGLFFTTLFGNMGGSEPIQMGIEMIQENPVSREYLGDNIEKGFGFSGSMNTTNGTGTADVSFKVSGDDGEAQCYLVAHKELGVWYIDNLDLVSLESGQRIISFENTYELE